MVEGGSWGTLRKDLFGEGGEPRRWRKYGRETNDCRQREADGEDQERQRKTTGHAKWTSVKKKNVP